MRIEDASDNSLIKAIVWTPKSTDTNIVFPMSMTFELSKTTSINVMTCDHNLATYNMIRTTSFSLHSAPSTAIIPHYSKTFTSNSVKYCIQCDTTYTFDDYYVCVLQVNYCYKYKNGVCTTCISGYFLK
jgi:predicted 3-demethylubiquinone-9 3-methyltransferase (glyoxalase superfamily)